MYESLYFILASPPASAKSRTGSLLKERGEAMLKVLGLFFSIFFIKDVFKKYYLSMDKKLAPSPSGEGWGEAVYLGLHRLP
jgi:hypothetical protein